MPFSLKKLKTIKKIIFISSLIFTFVQVNPHQVVLAYEINQPSAQGPVKLLLVSANPSLKSNYSQNYKITSRLPLNQELSYYTTYITATTYTSRSSETDNSPFIAAWGDHVFWGMIASNAFPKGTKIQIPDYFGSKIFIVLDRMNQRYYHHIDIWMPDLKQAKKWGSRYIKIKVYR